MDFGTSKRSQVKSNWILCIAFLPWRTLRGRDGNAWNIDINFGSIKSLFGSQNHICKTVGKASVFGLGHKSFHIALGGQTSNFANITSLKCAHLI
jgi:hypothetical protein